MNQLTSEEAIRRLKAIDDVYVTADMIAPVLRMNPDVLRKRVREGYYKISSVDVSENRIRFLRKDFLQKIGEMPPDQPEKSVNALLEEILEELRERNRIQRCMMSIGQVVRYEEMMAKAKESAGAATPAE